jgi:hypothetical protein
VFSFTAVGQIKNNGFAVAFFAVVFIEDWFGDHILFAGPISQVALAAAFTAKWKISMQRRIRGGFTYRAFVFHMVLPGLQFSPRVVRCLIAARGNYLDAARLPTDSLNVWGPAGRDRVRGFYYRTARSYPNTLSAAPVEIRVSCSTG